MKSRTDDMQALYNRLTEENKDILILVAKGMKEAVKDNGNVNGHSDGNGNKEKPL